MITSQNVLGPVSFPELVIRHNHGARVLKNATWHPYPADHKYNSDGRNGYVVGELVSGSVTSRLFHASCTRQEEPKKEYREDYCSLRKLCDLDRRWNGEDQTPAFELYSCG